MKHKTQKLTKETGYSNIWLTPPETYALLNKEFKFDLDAATEPDNPLNTPNYFTEDDNALDKEWEGNVWLNPPYSNIATWVKKAYKEFKRKPKRRIVMLIPARTDTRYFHEFIVPHAEVRFIKGRIKFSAKGSAPFPSIVVIYGKKNKPNIIVQERGK